LYYRVSVAVTILMLSSNNLISQLLDISSSFIFARSNELNTVFEKVEKIIPISNGLLCQIYKSKNKKTDFRVRLCSSYKIDKKFFTDYTSTKMIEIDPIIKSSYYSSSPILWIDALRSEFKNNEFTSFLAKYGMYNGLAYIFRDNNSEWSTYLCLGNNNSKIGSPHYLFITHLVPYFHNALKNISKLQITRAKNISLRELEVLRWVAEGKTYWEVSKILTISERTVRFHIGNVAEKLNAKNSTHAITKAIRLNLLFV